MRTRMFFLIIAICITVISIILSIFITGFFLFPIFCMLPMTCNLRNRSVQSEENIRDGMNNNSSSLGSQNKNEGNAQNKEFIRFCSKCGAQVVESKYNYCPICGKKILRVR